MSSTPNPKQTENTENMENTEKEPIVMASQYRLEMLIRSNKLEGIPQHILDEYKRRGYLLVSEEGDALLGSPMKSKKRKNPETPINLQNIHIQNTR